MKHRTHLAIILVLTLVGLTGVTALAAGPVESGAVTDHTGPIQFDNYVSVQTGMTFNWSTMNAAYGIIYVYGNYGTQATFASGVTDLCDIQDATDYTYNTTYFTLSDTSTGFVLLRRTASSGDVYYGAIDLIDVKPIGSYGHASIDATWYFQSNGTADFSTLCNSPPTADADGPYLAPTGGTFLVDGSGSADPDGDPLTATWTLEGATYDGVHATLTAPPTAGMYTVDLAVDDGRGGTATDTTYVVVYDPSAGFVTGGGWFDSPVGAYAADATLDGRATFGFTSQYKKGADVPTGNTEFQFHAAGLDFHSTSYDWLVVTGGDTAHFKGTGTIDGVDGYRFMIWAGDDDVDTFRIRIWTESDGVETDVYDNGAGHELGGGSIVVHTKNK